MSQSPPGHPAILYCHCQYAQVVPVDVKSAVLRRLCESSLPFEAVPDLCELAARRDPSLARLAGAGPVKIAACFPRAVKGLFAGAGVPLDAAVTEVVNMRTLAADEVAAKVLSTDLQPNLPAGRTTPADAPAAAGSASSPN